MENKYKVELWIKEIEEQCKHSNVLNFNISDKDTLKIVSNQYESIFTMLSQNSSLKIANLELKDRTIYKAIEEYFSTYLESRSNIIFSTSPINEQHRILNNLIEYNNNYLQKYSCHSLYFTFGILDYYDKTKGKELKSAPLVFMPIDIIFDKENNDYYIKAINKELFLNDALISYLKRTKKIDISAIIDKDFSIIDYLTFVSKEVHMMRWSVNNGCYISSFDLSIHNFLEEVILKQEEIANTSFIKSITYFHSEFFSFSHPFSDKLNKKYLSLLPIDNDEYHILDRISNRESLFLRCDSKENKYHIIQSILFNYLLNNKKVLITYENMDLKQEFIDNLDPLLNLYFVDLNERSINKKILIDRLHQDNVKSLSSNLLNPLTIQEILDKYYDSKNSFKKIINTLRRKTSSFSLSLNQFIELYYSYSCPMVNVEIPNIHKFTPEILDEYISYINDFKKSLKNLNCYYKEHPFYGFSKNSMTQEEYIPLKEAFQSLSKDLGFAIDIINNLYLQYNLPKVDNLKKLKALLNILSLLDDYIKIPKEIVNIVNFEDIYNTIQIIEEKHDKLESKIKLMMDYYSPSILENKNIIISTPTKKKKISRKDKAKLIPLFNKGFDLSFESLEKVKEDYLDIETLTTEIKNLQETLPNVINHYFYDGKYMVDSIKKDEETILKIKKMKVYLFNQSVPFEIEVLDKFKEKNNYLDLKNNFTQLQIIYNRILLNTIKVNQYFSPTINFESYDFMLYCHKAKRITSNFISINNYLDFLISLWKTNRIIKNLGDSLLEESDFTLYDSMFIKRFYHDYSLYLMKDFFKNKDSNDLVIEHIKNYEFSDENRLKLMESIIFNNFMDNIRLNAFTIKKYENAFLERELINEGFQPLSKLTSQGQESLYNKIPIIMCPLKSISTLLNHDTYKYDCLIILSDRYMKTIDTLSSLNKAKQMIVIDNNYLTKDSVKDYIDENELEVLVSASKKSLTTIEFTTKTYQNLPLRLNNKDINFKRYLTNYLTEEGFIVKQNVALKNGDIDLLVKVPSEKGTTAIIIDRLPYYSIESAKSTFEQENIILEKAGYFKIHVYPISFFNNEETSLKNLKQQILNNSKKNIHKKTTVIRKRITDVIFEEYTSPREFFYLTEKSTYDKRRLFEEILQKCAPIKIEEIKNLFPNEYELYVSLLLKDNKIEIKNNFIYVTSQEIIFKSCKKHKNQIRELETVCDEEILDGLKRIIKYVKRIEEGLLIQMILSSLGYEKMNASLYHRIENIIFEEVKKSNIILTEGIVKLNEESKENDINDIKDDLYVSNIADLEFFSQKKDDEL